MMVRSNDSSFRWHASVSRDKHSKRTNGLILGMAAFGLSLFGLVGQVGAQEDSSSDRLDFSDLQVISEAVDKPTSLLVVDIDEDGDDDVMAASSNDSSVRLFRNMGADADEQFEEVVLGTSESGANSVTVADMDGDGDLDVVASARLDDSVGWYAQHDLNSGNFGSFQAIDSELDGASYAAVGDLDGDGAQDVVATGYGADELVWYQNMGEDGFSAGTVIDSTRVGPWMADVMDLDADGDMDIVVAFYGGDEITAYINDGTGMFDSGTTMASDLDGATFLAKADVDQDGDYDILFVSYRDDRFGWFENMGDGVYSDANFYDVVVDGPSSIAASDIDRDGDMDVAITSLLDDRVIAFENLSDGLGDPIEVSVGELDGPRAIGIGDIDGDGNPDLVAGGGDNDTVGWFENFSDQPEVVEAPTEAPANVTGSYGIHSIYMGWDLVPDSGNGGSPISSYVATATPNGEGVVGQCTVSGTENRCQVLSLTPNIEYSITVRAENTMGAGPESGPAVSAVPVEPEGGAFELSDEIAISENSNAVTSVYAVDLDGDGDHDVLSASLGDSTIAWHENLGDDGFSEKMVLSDTVEKSYSVRAGDLDSDGDVDVLATTREGDAVVWFANNGDGTFGDKETLVGDVDEAVFAVAVDLDRDGDQDVVFASYAGDYVAWSENMGADGFGDGQMIATDVDGAWNLHVVDVNQDGRLDVISASTDDDTVAWYLNEGRGDFTQHVLSADSDSAAYVHAGDLDGDYDLDILAASYKDDTVAWFENMGGNTFSEKNIISSSADGVASVGSGDIDFDGDLDIFVASILDDTVVWHENTGGAFSDANLLSGHADGARSVHVVDMGGDGDADLFVGTYYDDSVSWWNNLSTLPPPVDVVDPGDDDEKEAPSVAPMNVQVIAGTESLIVSWDLITPTEVQPIDAYVVQATGPDGTTHTCRVEHPENSCTIEQLVAEVDYNVVVWAENEVGAGPASASVIGTPIRRIYGISGTLILENNFMLDGDTDDPNNYVEENDSIDEAQFLEIPGNVSGWVHGSVPADSGRDRNDYYEVELDGTPHSLILYAGGRTGLLREDLDLFLLDSDGTIIYTSNQPGVVTQESITTVDEDGTYYIQVEPWFSDLNLGAGYMLSVAPATEASYRLSQSESGFDNEFKFGEAIVKLKESPDDDSPQDIADKLIADGHFEISAGAPNREFLAKFDVSDAIVGDEVTIYGETKSFKNRRMAERYLTTTMIKELERLDEIDIAVPNYRFEVLATPNDPNYDDQWHYENIQLPDAWDVTTGSDDVVVAFIDSGYIDHPDLVDRLLEREDGSIAGYDFVSDPASSADGDGIDPDAFDSHFSSHGTFVAGIIGAETDNDEFTAGVSWESRLMPVRALGLFGSTEFILIQSVRYAAGLENDSGEIPDPKASVANISIGTSGCPRYNRPLSHSALWDDVSAEAFENGTLLVWASGNSGCPNIRDIWHLYEYTIVIGSTDSSDQRVPSSNYGEELMFVAPGQSVFSIASNSTSHGTNILSGTSFSAPHVVGVMALMLGANENNTVYDVYHLLRGTHPEWDEGPPVMDLLEPGRDLETGYGLIDAKKAVDGAAAITGGLGLIKEPRLRIPKKVAIIPSYQNHVELAYVNAGFGGEPLELTHVTSSEDWISGTVDESGRFVLSVDRSKLPAPELGGQREALITVHSNGGSKSMTALALIPHPGETGDIGTVYMAAIPLDNQNPVLEAQLDTSSGEFTFGWEDITYDDYIIVAFTNKSGVGGCALGFGEMCGIYGDAIDSVNNGPFLELRPTGPATPADIYMYFLGVGATPALLTQSEWESIMERISGADESGE